MALNSIYHPFQAIYMQFLIHYVLKIIFLIHKILKKIKFYKFNLCDTKKTLSLIKKIKPDIIIHLCCVPYSFNPVNHSFKYIKNNIISTLNIFESLKYHNPELIINFTSDKVYSNQNNNRKKEQDILGINDPYSFSKASSDNLGILYAKDYLNKKTKILNLRCGNIIGGGDWNKNRIIPDIIKSVFNNKNILLRNPNSVRPWMHVGEFLMSIIIILHKIKKLSKFSVFNIGPNAKDEITVKKLAIKISNLHLKRTKIIIHKRKNISETKLLKISSKKINDKLGWRSKLTINEKCSLTYNWYKCFYLRQNSAQTSY